MNEPFTNKTNQEESDISRKLQAIAEQTQATPYFVSELEEKLRGRHKPGTTWFLAWRDLTPTMGWVALALAVSALLILSIRTLVPSPQPGSDETPAAPTQINAPTAGTLIENVATPISDAGGFDWRGAKLILGVSLPDAPMQVHVYQLKKDQQATAQDARALADRFGIQGPMYTAFDYVFNVNDYYFTDGKRALQVYSNRRFTYTADLSKTGRSFHNTPANSAETIIREFLQVHGFDFPMKIQATDFFGGYSVEPLTPDGFPVQYESYTFPPMLIHLDENGNILSLDASLMDFDAAPLGTYGILTAQEALNKVLNDDEQGGKTEFFHSGGNSNNPQEWYRNYPDNQTITIQGYVSSYPLIDGSQPPLIFIDGVPAIGNTGGMEKLDRASFVQATGQYILQNDIRKFVVDSWKSDIEQAYITGSLHKDGDQIILTVSNAGTDQQAPLIGPGKQFPLLDPPADLPLDNKADSQLAVQGVLVNGTMDWYYIQYFENSSNAGGGGGGGGLGFYQLNLSGTPIPFPTPTAIPAQATIPAGASTYTVKENDTLAAIADRFGVTVEQLAQTNNLSNTNFIYVGQTLYIPEPERQELNEQPVTDMRGFLSILIRKKADGTQVKEYSLQIYEADGFTSYPLTGADLSELDAYNALPVLISGTLTIYGPTSTLNVDSYKIPFPNLHFQILKGRQESRQIGGATVIVFTTEDGQSYVEFMSSTQQTTDAYIGLQGDLIQQEVLIVPDETFGGMPVIRVYQSSVMGGASEMQIQANRISVFDESSLPIMPSDYTPPNLTIEQVELVYFVNNNYYQVNDPNYSNRSTYIQPVWHFHGHYENGDGYDVLIQALKPEFLKPEIQPGLSPG